MNSSLLINEEIRSGISDVDEYISLLEGIVEAYTADNATRLLAESNRIIGLLADDFSNIAEDGSIKNTKLIKAEKNNMIVDRIVTLLKQADTITNVSKKAVEIGRKIAEFIHLQPEEKAAPVTEASTEEKAQSAKDALQEEHDEQLISGGVPAIESLVKELTSKGKTK